MGNGGGKGGEKIDLISPALRRFAVNVRLEIWSRLRLLDA